jgi:hypothetical protein
VASTTASLILASATVLRASPRIVSGGSMEHPQGGGALAVAWPPDGHPRLLSLSSVRFIDCAALTVVGSAFGGAVSAAFGSNSTVVVDGCDFVNTTASAVLAPRALGVSVWRGSGCRAACVHRRDSVCMVCGCVGVWGVFGCMVVAAGPYARGGAISLIMYDDQPMTESVVIRIHGCTFVNNTVVSAWRAAGGAVSVYGGLSVTGVNVSVDSCVFSGSVTEGQPVAAVVSRVMSRVSPHVFCRFCSCARRRGCTLRRHRAGVQ